MKAFLRPQNRHTLVAALLVALVIGGSLLPLSGAETKSKKSASKSTSSATPKAKKSSSGSSGESESKKAKASPTPKTTPKPSKTTPGAKKSTPRPSPKAKSVQPEPKNSTTSSNTENEAANGEGDPPEVKPPTTPKATPSRSKSGRRSLKPEIPGQPAPALPQRGASPDSAQPPATPSAKVDPPSSESSTPAEATSIQPTPVSLTTPSVPPLKTPEDTGPDTPEKGKQNVAPNVSISPEDLLGFEEQPPRVQELIKAALELTKQKLTYTYGSADPNNGGMDCSGAIHYLLKQQGFSDVPRDASGQYVWARKTGKFFAVVSKKADSFEFGDLLPGDLLFWNGTYKVDRDPPVTHTMIYLGVQRRRAQHVMWGSSDGRTYDSRPRWGVSVFDFKMPRADKNILNGAKADFLGYARIPGLRE